LLHVSFLYLYITESKFQNVDIIPYILTFIQNNQAKYFK